MPRVRAKSATGIEKPRGRMGSYAYFVQTCREEHKNLHPEERVQFKEFSKQCAQRWGTMNEKEKAKFIELADRDKARYESEMKDYVPVPSTGRRARRARGSKKPKDPTKPKRALSAFFYYANGERANVRKLNPDFSVGEVAKELGRQWNELGEEDKAPFEKDAELDRARYDRDMRLWKAGELPAANGNTNGHVPHHDASDQDDESDDE